MCGVQTNGRPSLSLAWGQTANMERHTKGTLAFTGPHDTIFQDWNGGHFNFRDKNTLACAIAFP